MERWIQLAVGQSPMRCYVAEATAPNGAGILVCMHGPGLDDFIQDICRRLAGQGYCAIAPYLYHRMASPPPPEAYKLIRDPEALADMATALAALRALPGIDRGRIGVVGFCMGGRLAFLQAAHDAELRALVMFHGGNIMVGRGGMPSPLEQAGQIGAPALGLFGEEDTNPSPADVRQIEAELTRLGKVHEFHSYAGAGHAFLNFTNPKVYREAQGKDAWQRCVEWLFRYLH